MKFKRYDAVFYKRNEKDELVSLGSQEIFCFENDKMSRIAKAFLHAQGSQKDAIAIEFVEIR